ncbi:DUF397 domain-containing protein [Streptomyces sp. NPDC046215]|uniref:DUF397 domain-containing protein n=1 Tax=Streptomyces stramineus TaxID=173861 RepID=A0ABN1B751_9ACTN
MKAIRTELSHAVWRKSTYSVGDEECLEIADNIPGNGVPVRDSKRPQGAALIIPAAAWTTFVTAVRSGKLPR